MVRDCAAGGNDAPGTPAGDVRKLTGRTLFGTATRGERNSSALLGSSGFGIGGGVSVDSSFVGDFDLERKRLLKENAMAAKGVWAFSVGL